MSLLLYTQEKTPVPTGWKHWVGPTASVDSIKVKFTLEQAMKAQRGGAEV
jgi:hypothetical protein